MLMKQERVRQAARADHYRSYMLGALLVIFAFNQVDRIALGLLLQSIKVDLQVSDTQMGLLSGLAFAVFYSFMGIPIGRLADRGDRVAIISITAMIWSLAVMLCGFTHTFTQLLLVRIVAAVGEAGCIPPAHSLLAEQFDRSERPRAFARLMLGGPLSIVIGYLAAGWINDHYGWRATFIAMGAPGLGLAILAWLTLKEPRRSRARSDTKAADGSIIHGDTSTDSIPNYFEVFRTLWQNHSFRHLLYGFSILYFFNYGIMKWQPTFFIRSFGLKTGDLGVWLTAIYGIGGSLGAYFGGELAARLAKGNESLQLKAAASVYWSFAPISMIIYLSSSVPFAFSLLGATFTCSAAVIGPLFSIIQSAVPDRMRATAISILYLFANLIGMGLGPLAAGVLSDTLSPWVGAESLRYSLLVLSPGYAWVGLHLWKAARTISRDVSSISQPVVGSTP